MAKVAVVLALLGGFAMAGAGSAFARTLVVDRDKVQCPRAGYTAIQAAVAAAQPGDTVVVCPDLYTEDVTVPKPLTIVGAGASTDTQGELDTSDDGRPVPVDCFTAATADPTKDAIVTGASFSFDLQADDVTLRRLVIQGSSIGVLTSDTHSGYRLVENVIQSNVNAGVNFLSSGERLSRIDHNCLRFNGAGGVASELGDLRNARLDHNHTYRLGGFDLSGAGVRRSVTIDHNTSREDFGAVLISNSTDSVITRNDASGNIIAVTVAGGNVGLVVSYNHLRDGTSNGIVFATFLSLPAFPASVEAKVIGNDVSGFRFDGIQGAADSVSRSLFAGNQTHDNGRDGIRLRAGDTDNVVAGNRSDRNRRNGIYAQLATGNRFVANSMHGNLVYDARDDARPSNTWLRNSCVTDFPAGTICAGSAR